MSMKRGILLPLPGYIHVYVSQWFFSPAPVIQAEGNELRRKYNVEGSQTERGHSPSLHHSMVLGPQKRRKQFPIYLQVYKSGVYSMVGDCSCQTGWSIKAVGSKAASGVHLESNIATYYQHLGKLLGTETPSEGHSSRLSSY